VPPSRRHPNAPPPGFQLGTPIQQATESRNDPAAYFVQFSVKSVFAILLFLLATAAQAQPVPLPKDFTQQATAYVDAFAKAGRFNGAVLIQIDGKVVLRKAYGFADFQKKTPMTPETPMAIFSISKSFTAGAILLLQEKGLLSTEDRASRYLDDLPASWKDITIQQFVTHTSGIGDAEALAWYEKRYGHPLVDSDFTKRPATDPGSKFEYSNLGYMVLGEIVAKVSGKPFDTFLQEEIFTPLKMTGAGTGGYWEKQKVARGHRMVGGLVMPSDQYLSIIRGAGNVHANVDDLLKWRTAIDQPGFFSDASRKILHTPYVSIGGESSYGYGWFYHGEYPFWEHTGSGASCETSLNWLPEREMTIVILKNSDDSMGPLFSTELVNMAYAIKPHLPKFVPYERLTKYQGVYRTKSGGEATVAYSNDSIGIRLPSGAYVLTEYAGGNKYQCSGVVAAFEPRKDGLFDLRLVLNGKTTWKGEPYVSPVTASQYAGTFGEGGMSLSFQPCGKRLAIKVEDKQATPDALLVPLFPGGKDRFQLVSPGGKLEFIFLRDTAGKTTGVMTRSNGKVTGTLSRKTEPVIRKPLSPLGERGRG